MAEGERSLKRLKSWGLLFASAAVTLLLVEACFRIVGAGARSRTQSADVNVPDPRLGWSKRPDSKTTFESAEYSVELTINAQGLRGPERAIPKPSGTRRVLLLGDSFLVGRGVADDSVVSVFLQQRLDAAAGSVGPIEVVNGGTAGYSTDQELLFYRDDGVRYEPDITVLLFFLNDVTQNRQSWAHGHSKPRFRLDTGGRLTLGDPLLEPDAAERSSSAPSGLRGVGAWLASHSNLYRFVRSATWGPGGVLYGFVGSNRRQLPVEWRALQVMPGPAVAESWRLTEALLGTLRDEVEAAGSRFAVFYVPSLMAVRDSEWAAVRNRYRPEGEYAPTRDAEALADICSALALDCLIDTESFRRVDGETGGSGLYFSRDAHWTPAGHVLAAELLAEHIMPHLVASER